MLEIPGIDPDKVRRYGKRFLKLVGTSQQGYESMMAHQEDRPRDPNHQNVIDISSDDEFGDGSLGGLGEIEGSQGETSTYFQPPDEVLAFNARRRLTFTNI